MSGYHYVVSAFERVGKRWAARAVAKPLVKSVRRFALAAACTVVVSTLGACSGGKQGPSDDTMAFCANLGASMMTVVSPDVTVSPEEFQQKFHELQDTADRIADSDADWSDLGQTTSQYLAATDSSSMASAHTKLQRYCNEHRLSPFPQKMQREAYGAFLERYLKLTRFLGETEKKIRTREYTEADAVRVASSAGSQLDDLLTSSITVQLEGPAELGNHAHHGHEAMRRWWTSLARLANALADGDAAMGESQAVAEAQRQAGEQIGAFAILAQQLLNKIR